MVGNEREGKVEGVKAAPEGAQGEGGVNGEDGGSY